MSKQEMHQLTIRSTPLIYTPGFFEYIKAMYQTDKKNAKKLLVELTNGLLTTKGANCVLNGTHKTETLKDSICLHVPANHLNLS